jgi:hypothetical protein
VKPEIHSNRVVLGACQVTTLTGFPVPGEHENRDCVAKIC